MSLRSLALFAVLLCAGPPAVGAGSGLHQPALVELFYARAGQAAVWDDPRRTREALRLLEESELEGLDPRDYHGQALREGHRELLLTDGLLLYARHLLYGKVDPRQLEPGFHYKRRGVEPERLVDELLRAVLTDRLGAYLAGLRPDNVFYRAMRRELARYRELAATEEFHPLPTDTVLRPGLEHPHVRLLRQRLAELGYLAPQAHSSAVYDDTLTAAVRQFQRDQRLAVDGIVGERSFRLLNLSYARRVDILRINLDRVRWMPRDLPEDYLVVNIAGFELHYLRRGEPIWETPVMVGSVAHQTPGFSARLAYLEFNPAWSVPRSIAVRNLLPSFRADPGRIERDGFRFYDRERNPVDPESIDLQAIGPNHFPYRLEQQPGPRNALGQVKFIFPSSESIYLHDTPSQELFDRSERAFSAGCVRVKEPLRLAELLLNDPARWSIGQLEALVAAGDPQHRVFLERPVEVMLVYWTSSLTPDGRMLFYRDIYDKDSAALAALQAPPQGGARDHD